MKDYPLRLGQSWLAHDPEQSPFVTVIRVGEEEPDERGHRSDDRLLGVLYRAEAAQVVELVNGSSDPQAAATFVEVLLEYRVRAAGQALVGVLTSGS